MIDFDTACRIAYPLRDPVVSDTARHLDQLDRDEAISERIDQLISEYVGTQPGRNSLVGDPEVDAKLDILFACVMTSRTDASIRAAANELRTAATLAATRLAVADLKRELAQSAEDAAVAAWEDRQGGCDD